MQKIVFVTQRDPFFVDSFLREFLTYGYDVTILDLPNFNRGKAWAIRRALNLYGISGFAKLLRQKVVSGLANLVSGTRISSTRLNTLPSIDAVPEHLLPNAILVSLSAPCTIPISWLKAFRSSVNLHCGALPEYSGMMPIFWQAYHGEKEVTITLHHMAPEIDAGDIIETMRFPFCETLFLTSVRAKKLSAKLLHSAIQKGLPSTVLDMAGSRSTRLYGFPSRTEVKQLSCRLKLI